VFKHVALLVENPSAPFCFGIQCVGVDDQLEKSM